jgi:hypothetical protein
MRGKHAQAIPAETITAEQIAVDFRRGNSSRDLDILQARRPRAPEQGLKNRAGDLDGVDAVTGGLTRQIKILRNDRALSVYHPRSRR